VHPSWQSKVVRYADVAPADLLVHPDNVTIHTVEQQADMERMFKRIGWAASVLVSVNSGRIIDGHMRVAVALNAGAATVPVDYADLSEEERKALLYLKRMPSLAGLDRVNLAEVLEQVATLDADIEAMASAFARSSGLLRQQKLMAEKETPQHVDVTMLYSHPGSTRYSNPVVATATS
jgi:ParB-like chromosome segregation protein Spo0J